MNKLHKVQKGFTLVELMIVVLIIGILASIAVPNYQEYVRRARATDATSTLADLRIRMEQYFQDNRTYAGFNCVAPGANQQFFAFNCATNLDTYTITAAGVGPMAAYQYTVNQRNQKTSSLNGACWSVRDDGAC